MDRTGHGQTGDGLKERTRAQLLRLYPYKDLLGPEEFAFDEGEEIRDAIVDGTLAARLPAWRFFKTRLTTSYEEYPCVEIVVGVDANNPDDVRILKAPSFSPRSPEFFDLFKGMRAPTGPDRDTLAAGIANLLASLVHKGRIEVDEILEDRSVWKLFRGDASRNLVIFEFDQNDRLAAIQIERGSC
jgi:hypothetical protein